MPAAGETQSTPKNISKKRARQDLIKEEKEEEEETSVTSVSKKSTTGATKDNNDTNPSRSTPPPPSTSGTKITAAKDNSAGETATQPGSQAPPVKRKRMSVACLGCRARKIKCDGRKPKCLNCELYHDECTFVFHNDKRKPYPKEYIDALNMRIGMLETVLERKNIDLDVEIKELENERKMAKTAISESGVDQKINKRKKDSEYADRLTDRVGQLSMTNIGLRYFGPTSNLHLLSSIIWTRRPNSNIEFKGRAAIEAAGLNYEISDERRTHLLNLYWTWQHPYFNVTDKSLFLRDMYFYEHGMASQAKFYSPLLLNAILAAAALLDDKVSDREVFHLKARILIDIEVEDPRITTVQAAAILGAYEGVCDRDTRGWIYSGIAMRMALDMGMHLDSQDWVDKNIITREEAHMRKITFWGCYIYNVQWSFYMGRPLAMRFQDIQVEKPSEKDANAQEEKEAWVPYIGKDEELPKVWREYTAPVRLNLTMIYLTELVEMISAIQENLYSASEAVGLTIKHWNFKSQMHTKMTNWYANLPSPLLCSANSQRPIVSHIVVLHMQYHAAQILLHRPFLCADITPNYSQEICRNSATTFTNLLEQYRSNWYSMRRINVISVHLIFTISTIHLLNAWTEVGTYKTDATQGIKTCCLALSELGRTFETAKRTLAVLTCLLNKGNRHSGSYNKTTDALPFTPSGPDSTTTPSIGFNMNPGLQLGHTFSHSTGQPQQTLPKWRPEIQRTRVFQIPRSPSTVASSFPSSNNSGVPITDMNRTAQVEDHDDIYDQLISTTSGRLPNSFQLPENNNVNEGGGTGTFTPSEIPIPISLSPIPNTLGGLGMFPSNPNSNSNSGTNLAGLMEQVNGGSTPHEQPFSGSTPPRDWNGYLQSLELGDVEF